MRGIILFTLIIGIIAVILIVAWLNTRTSLKRSEYTRLKRLENEVTHFALTHMDVDPTARSLFHIIQENKEGKSIK